MIQVSETAKQKVISLMTEEGFDASKDFLVIPEVLAGEIGSFCLKNNLKYGIFVQNGYLIQKGKNKKTSASPAPTTFQPGGAP